MINGVVFEDIPEGHEDHRRRLYAPFNGDVPGFARAMQVKVAEVKQGENIVLGKHYHLYAELFFVLKGQVTFKLTELGGAGETNEFVLVPGKRLLIPIAVQHEGLAQADSILIGLTEERYVSPEHNDRKY